MVIQEESKEDATDLTVNLSKGDDTESQHVKRNNWSCESNNDVNDVIGSQQDDQQALASDDCESSSGGSGSVSGSGSSVSSSCSCSRSRRS